jgi:N-acetylmuramoyl-L-alanine amidase
MRSLAKRALRCVAAAAVFGALVCHAAAEGSPDASNEPGEPEIAIANPDAAGPAAKHKVLRTRFVVGLERKADYRVFAISHPNRVVVELPDINLQIPHIDEKAPVGLVKAVRSGLSAPGKIRIVIGVTQPVVVENSEIERDKNGHFRLAVIIRPVTAMLSTGTNEFAASSGLGVGPLQPPVPRLAENPATRAAKAFRPVIVLDPGHGGYDSGAVKRGTIEKNVVLAFSLVLRDQLKKTGRYKVLMTRDDDTFVSLGGRTEFAERHGANLFIAIHADYSDNGSRARGATIYTLRDRVAKNLERSAKGNAAENVLSAEEIETVKKVSDDVGAVKSILADLAERDLELTHERTGMFAKTVIENMGESTQMRSEPDKQAAFRVLKTAQFPSVLIELAYITNQQDANNLKSEEWREKVAQSIVSAIDNYFSHEIAHLPM